MSFIGSIKSFITESVPKALGLTPPDAKKTSSKAAVIEVKTDAPVDRGDFGKSDPQKVSKANIRALQQTIEVSCNKNGIDKKLLYEAVFKMLNIKDMKEFKDLPEEKQAMFLGFIGATIKRAEAHATKANKHVDITKIVIVDIKLAIDAINKKALEVSDISEINNNKDLKKTSNNFLQNINTLSDAEMDDAISELETKIQSYLHAEMVKINNISDPAKKAEAIKKLHAKVDYMRNQIYNEVLMGADNEHAVGAITVVSSKNLPEAAQNLFKTRKTSVERQQAANLFTFDRVHNRIVKAYYDKGDELSTEAYREFSTEVISHMSAPAASAYREDYIEARLEYERTGYPEYMRKEMLTEAAAAIVAGTERNEFMTADEKTAAINEFYKNEEKVKEKVKEIAKERAAEKDTKTAKKEETADSRQELPVSEAEAIRERLERAIFYDESSSIASRVRSKTGPQSVTDPITQENNKNTTDDYNYSKAPSPAKIEYELSQTGVAPKDIAEKFKVSENKVYRVIFSKPSLLERYEQDAVKYIKDNKKHSKLLINLALSDEAIVMIRKYADVDNKPEFDAELEKRASSVQKHLFKEEKKEREAHAANK